MLKIIEPHSGLGRLQMSAEKGNAVAGRFRRLLYLLLAALPVHAQYAVQRSGGVIQLIDKAHETTVSVDPSLGDLLFEMKVKGQSVVHFPLPLEEYKQKGGPGGIPFLAPWANRLDEQAFYANGKKYPFNMSLGNVRGATPMHGFLMKAPWEIVEAGADKKSAWLTCPLEFYRNPDWMAQFPFAQVIEITQRLHDGDLEVHTKIQNLSTEPMPVAIGFHPYYQLTDSERDEWKVTLGAKQHYLLESNKIPSGKTEPVESFFHDPQPVALKPYDIDDVFGDLIRDPGGIATASVAGRHQKLTLQFGPKFQNVVMFAPKNSPDPTKPQRDTKFVCFEPMASITDALNLRQAGKYSALQSIAPGGVWEESFWVRPSGF